MLDKVFVRALDHAQPRSVTVLGASGGSGFEVLADRALDRVVAVDINPRYLESLKTRFTAALPTLRTVCGDVADPELDLPRTDLVHAALIFEYVAPARLLRNAHRWLQPHGTLSVVLQLQVRNKPAVSETPFQSLATLSSVMQFLEPDRLTQEAATAGFRQSLSERIDLVTGKAFQFLLFERA
jgi:SAM-dependent methyltransferase